MVMVAGWVGGCAGIRKLIVLRSSPGDLGRVRSQGLRPPRARRCQGNCATILTSVPAPPPSSLALPLTTPPPSPRQSRGGAGNVLSTLMKSAPRRGRLSVCPSVGRISNISPSKPRPVRRPEGRRRTACPRDGAAPTTIPGQTTIRSGWSGGEVAGVTQGHRGQSPLARPLWAGRGLISACK